MSGKGVCRYFLEGGGCRYGDKCKFTHTRQNTARGEDRREVCKHFLSGRCRFGDNCRFSHSTGERQGGQEYGGQRGEFKYLVHKFKFVCSRSSSARPCQQKRWWWWLESEGKFVLILPYQCFIYLAPFTGREKQC